LSGSKRKKIIHSLAEIPAFHDEAEEHAFWSNHELGDEISRDVEPLDQAELPDPRIKPSRKSASPKHVTNRSAS